jgi:hypothetical protein
VDKRIQAARTPRPPVVDGRLDEPEWALAPADDRFTQDFPSSGARPSMRTSVRVLYDDRALYVGVTAYDPRPESILARLSRRDRTVPSDAIHLYLDPRHDHDTGYWFWINAAGVLADGQLHDDNRTNADWDAVWRGRARIGDFGWSAELAIPHAVLRFPRRAPPAWGFNLLRVVGRSQERMMWAFSPRSEQGLLSRAGHIDGIAGLAPARAIELRPFAVARAEAALPRGGGLGLGGGAERDARFELGVDLKAAVTRDLTLDLTVLPDFGQVEADPVVLNLSTYETHFPEKRPFLLENADLFATDIGLFYSRRIGGRSTALVDGADVTGDQGERCAGQEPCQVEVTAAPLAAPIWAAARLSGRLTRRFTLAALSALTGPDQVTLTTRAGDQPPAESTLEVAPITSYTAARGKYSLGGSSYLGFLATGALRAGAAVEPAVDHDALAESVDGRWVARDGAYRLYFQLAASHRLGGPRWLDGDEAACAAATCRPIQRADGTLLAPGDLGWAGEFGGGKVGGRHWLLWSSYQFATGRFDVNDVGFEPDWDYHKAATTLTYREQRPFWRLQEGALAATADAVTGFDGLAKEATLRGRASWTYRNLWSQALAVHYRPGGAWTTRETSDGARFQRTRYAWVDLSAATDGRRELGGSLWASAGGSLDDGSWFAGAGAGLDVRAVAPLELALTAGFDLSEDAVRFTACSDPVRGSCSLLSARRDYRFADLDSGSLSLTARASLALSPDLSIQGYGQLFAARGRYLDYREITGQLGPRPFLYRRELAPSDYRGDSDGDGVEDDDFAFATLNANLVLRWELRPGAALMVVYTRAQRADVELGGARPVIGYRGLARGATEEILLAKLTWYVGR